MPGLEAVVFEDDDNFRLLFGRIFKNNGIKARCFDDPGGYLCTQPGINKCPVSKPCTGFLLTDNKIPGGMNGLDFLIHSEKIGCKIPKQRKAIVSSNWIKEEREEAQGLAGRIIDKYEAKDQIRHWIASSPSADNIRS